MEFLPIPDLWVIKRRIYVRRERSSGIERFANKTRGFQRYTTSVQLDLVTNDRANGVSTFFSSVTFISAI